MAQPNQVPGNMAALATGCHPGPSVGHSVPHEKADASSFLSFHYDSSAAFIQVHSLLL